MRKICKYKLLLNMEIEEWRGFMSGNLNLWINGATLEEKERERERERERLALSGLSLLFSSFPVLILYLVMQKWTTALPYFTSLRASSFCSLLTAINLFRPTCITLLLTVAIQAVSLQLLTAEVVRTQSHGSTYGTNGEQSSFPVSHHSTDNL
jgi:hypothetical protein